MSHLKMVLYPPGRSLRPVSALSIELQCYVESIKADECGRLPPPLPTLTMHDPLDDVWTSAGPEPEILTDEGWVTRWTVETHGREEALRKQHIFKAELHDYADAVAPYLGRALAQLDLAGEEDYRKLTAGILSGFRFQPGRLYRALEVEPLLPEGTFDAFCSLDNFYVPGEILIRQVRQIRASSPELFFVIELWNDRAMRAIIHPKRAQARSSSSMEEQSSTLHSTDIIGLVSVSSDG